jgi:hypothetical protein
MNCTTSLIKVDVIKATPIFFFFFFLVGPGFELRNLCWQNRHSIA